ncbi:CHAT domain-containing protein [Vacuolonema iberomarrocanum]|uniref:CHAT domain-containing protein n=1 Tax=Vacuolonema iberomarrocanum TaxID=3454632 RepID=UPI001A0990F1|nr:CHAT domain-containing protein [filamentous cyanobacterium LEGE 07170]
MPENPCLRLAIDRLNATTAADHFAIWVIQAPHPSGYAHHDQNYPEHLIEAWRAWQSFFSSKPIANAPVLPSLTLPDSTDSEDSSPSPYTSRLMQYLGILLWRWVFDGSIQNSLDQSRGIALGQGTPLRLRLELRDPNLIAIPWEIMQHGPGQRAVGLSQQVLFSRTTYEVDPLAIQQEETGLKVLLVQGINTNQSELDFGGEKNLDLEREAEAIAQAFSTGSDMSLRNTWQEIAHCEIDILIQPTPSELTAYLESKHYNVLFYSGHGMPGPDGGMLYLRPEATLNGTELAQLLTRCRIKLAVFNACWGAQPDMRDGYPIPRSSLSEVLIHHGVPAVLAMRDTIADHEALSFIQVFARSLSERLPIDEAVAVSRQHLLTLYRFNQPAWTLPVLYMHPEFDGELLRSPLEGTTEMPESPSNWVEPNIPAASLRPLETSGSGWPIQGGRMRIGGLDTNDLVLRGAGVSRQHAEIFYRDCAIEGGMKSGYFLRDFSRYGTLMLMDNRWYRIHRQEIPLQSGTRLCFGTHRVEFLVDGTDRVG